MLSFQPNKLIKNVILFGTGGTGGRLVPLITQLLTTMTVTKNARVILVDGDEVEEKNCKRQLFIPAEIGKNKAEVLAKRYNRAFGANTFYLPEFFPVETNPFESEDTVLSCSPLVCSSSSFTGKLLTMLSVSSMEQYEETRATLRGETEECNTQRTLIFRSSIEKAYKVLSSGLTVFILAVDSVPARQAILTWIQTLASRALFKCGSSSPKDSVTLADNMIVIDGGNEDVFGQVNYFHPVTIDLCPFKEVHEMEKRAFFSSPTAIVPFPIGRYRNMEEGVSERRCGDIDQTLSVNQMVATMMHLIFHNLFYNVPMNFHRINFNLNGAMTTEYMTLQWLKGVVTNDTQYVAGLLDSPYSEEDTDMNTYSFYTRSAHDQALFGVVSTPPTRTTVKKGFYVSPRYCCTRREYDSDAGPGGSPQSSQEVVTNMILEEEFSSKTIQQKVSAYTEESNVLRSSWSNFVIPILYEQVKRGHIHEKLLRSMTLRTLLNSSWSSIFKDTLLHHGEFGIVPDDTPMNGYNSKVALTGYSCVSENTRLPVGEDTWESCAPYTYTASMTGGKYSLVNRDGLPVLGLETTIVAGQSRRLVSYFRTSASVSLMYDYLFSVIDEEGDCLDRVNGLKADILSEITTTQEFLKSINMTGLVFSRKYLIHLFLGYSGRSHRNLEIGPVGEGVLVSEVINMASIGYTEDECPPLGFPSLAIFDQDQLYSLLTFGRLYTKGEEKYKRQNHKALLRDILESIP